MATKIVSPMVLCVVYINIDGILDCIIGGTLCGTTHGIIYGESVA